MPGSFLLPAPTSHLRVFICWNAAGPAPLKRCAPAGAPKYVAADAATARAMPASTPTCDCLVWLSGRVILSEGPAGAVVEQSSRNSEMAA